jgi:hypothetical protein
MHVVLGLVFWLFCQFPVHYLTVIRDLAADWLITGDCAGDPSFARSRRVPLTRRRDCLLAWLVRAGAIVNFISETVLIGFKAGVAFYLASTQLPKLFGFKGGEGSFWRRSGHFLAHLDETNPAALVLGLSALAILVLGKVFLKNKPVSIVVVIGGIVVASLLHIEARGVKILEKYRRECRTWACRLCIGLISMTCCRWQSPVLCWERSRPQPSDECSPRNTAAGSTAIKSFWLAAGNLLAGLGRGLPVSGGTVAIAGE